MSSRYKISFILKYSVFILKQLSNSLSIECRMFFKIECEIFFLSAPCQMCLITRLKEHYVCVRHSPKMPAGHSGCWDHLSPLIASFGVQFSLNFLPLCFSIFISLSHCHLSFIMMKFMDLPKSLCSVNTYPVIFPYNSCMSRVPRKCYCCTVKSYSLELYLQFSVRELFPLFWQGS